MADPVLVYAGVDLTNNIDPYVIPGTGGVPGTPVTPSANALQVVFVKVMGTTDNAVIGITGCSITNWAQIGTANGVLFSTTGRWSVWAGYGASPTAGSLSIDMAGNRSQIQVVWVEWADADLSGGTPASAFVATNLQENAAAAVTSRTVTFNALADAPNVLLIGVATHLVDPSTGNPEPEAGWTELGQSNGTGSSSDSGSAMVAWRGTGDLTGVVSWAGAGNAAAIGVEIKKAVAPPAEVAAVNVPLGMFAIEMEPGARLESEMAGPLVLFDEEMFEVAADAGTPVSNALAVAHEAMGFLSATLQTVHEAIASVTASLPTAHEALAALSLSLAVQYEGLAGVSLDQATAHEAIGSAAATQLVAHEASAQAAATLATVHEALEGATAAEDVQHEALSLASATQQTAQEGLGFLSVAQLTAYEATGPEPVSNAQAVQHEGLASLSTARSVGYDVVSALSATSTTGHEALAALSVTQAVQHEALAGVTATRSTAHEALGVVAAQLTAAHETSAQVVATQLTWHETLSPVTTQQPTAYEAQQGTIATLSVSHEALGYVSSQQPVAWDAEASPNVAAPALTGTARVYPTLSATVRAYPTLTARTLVTPTLSAQARVYPTLSARLRVYPTLSAIIKINGRQVMSDIQPTPVVVGGTNTVEAGKLRKTKDPDVPASYDATAIAKVLSIKDLSGTILSGITYPFSVPAVVGDSGTYRADMPAAVPFVNRVQYDIAFEVTTVDGSKWLHRERVIGTDTPATVP